MAGRLLRLQKASGIRIVRAQSAGPSGKPKSFPRVICLETCFLESIPLRHACNLSECRAGVYRLCQAILKPMSRARVKVHKNVISKIQRCVLIPVELQSHEGRTLQMLLSTSSESTSKASSSFTRRRSYFSCEVDLA
eukprot:4334588-Amphidinium_carterae.1